MFVFIFVFLISLMARDQKQLEELLIVVVNNNFELLEAQLTIRRQNNNINKTVDESN